MRYAPGRAFPPYAFIPGQNPHPTRDPEGHSYGEPEPAGGYFPPEDWRTNEDYLFGIDLYNHGYLWEAHEAWEGLWHRAKGDEAQALHLQGLIQCAAACLKIPMGQPRGLARLSQLGTEKLERVAASCGGSFMGLDLDAFVTAVRSFAESAPDSIEARPRIALDAE